MSSDDSSRSSYLDLLVATLIEHEKNLSDIIDKMEKVIESLSIDGSLEKTTPKIDTYKKTLSEELDNSHEDLVYMRIRIRRPIRDLLEILRSLKE
jgi:hypothetical protein